MSNVQEHSPFVLFVNGIIGSGKSTAVEYLQRELVKQGIRVHVQDSFKWVKAWAELHRDDPSKVTWTTNSLGVEDFYVDKRAYKELSEYVATQAAEEVAQREGESQHRSDVYIHEAARGAGVGSQESDTTRDSYTDLFTAFRRVLVGRNPRFAQVEVVLPTLTRDVHVQRMQKPGRPGAPPELIDRYLDENGLPQSATQHAKPFNMEINESVSNEGSMEELFSKLERITQVIIATLLGSSQSNMLTVVER